MAQGGIRPRRVIGHTQYYDVMAAMLDRGVGIASFADTMLPPEMRDAVQAFLVSSVLQDPNYRTISIFADEFA